MPSKINYWKNPDKYRKASRDCNRKRYENDLEFRKKGAIRSENWRRTTAKGRYCTIKKSSRIRKMPLEITQKEFIKWFNEQKPNCYYCKKPNNKENLEIERLDNNMPYKLGNIKFACHDCNSVKGEILSEKEMLIVGKLIMEKKWKTKI
jgi:RNA recognition motif-containing protein